MPLAMDDADDDSSLMDETREDGVRFGGNRAERSRFNQPRWDEPGRFAGRPASRARRIFIAVAALVVVSGFAASAYLLKTYLERDARFRIDGAGDIQASGLTQVSRDQILPVFGEDIGRNVFYVPLAERRKQLEEIPWIEKATVMRLLPDQIRVSVVERQPVAFARQGDQFGLVDANGVLLTMPAALMAQHNYSFPVVTGIDPRDPLASRRERMQVYQRLLAELDANGQKLSAQISEIDLTDPSDAKVLMPEPGGDILAHFGQDHFLQRYQRYKAHIGEWRQQYPKLAAVDLRYDQQVVLQMAPGTDVAQAAAQPSADAPSGTSGDAQPATPTAAQPAVRTVKSKPIHALAATGGGAHARSRQVRVVGKPGGKASAKTKAARAKALLKARKVAKNKTRQRKRAAASRRAAQNIGKQKTTPTPRPFVITGQGQ